MRPWSQSNPDFSPFLHMINWSEIDLVLLDMDGTLLDLNFDMQFWLQLIPQKYGELHGMDRDTARDIVLPKIMAKQGTLEWYSVDYWSETLELDVLALNHELVHLIQPRPGTMAFMDALKASKITTWLATNAWPATVDIKMDRVNLRPYLDNIISSHDFGAAKEHPDFWRKLATTHQVPAKRCLFIDDSLSVLRAADRAGIGHLLTIDQPNLSEPPRTNNEFPSLSHFDQIMPKIDLAS